MKILLFLLHSGRKSSKILIYYTDEKNTIRKKLDIFHQSRPHWYLTGYIIFFNYIFK